MSSGDFKVIMRNKEQLIETDPEMTQKIELVDTDIEAAIITIYVWEEKGKLQHVK